jgi:hypothetical protein
MHIARVNRDLSAPAYCFGFALLLCNFASAQDKFVGQTPLAKHQASQGLNEAALIRRWPKYFKRSQPILSDRGDRSGFEQTLTIVPRAGNPIALLSYLPQEGADDAPYMVDYRLNRVFPKLELAYVSAGYWENVHHFFYRLANGEQIVADGAPYISPNGERLLVLACGESAFGKIEAVFDVFEIQDGWLKRVYQHPLETYAAEWCPENVVWRSNNEITFNYVHSPYATDANKRPNVPGLLRRIDQRWQLIRTPPTSQPLANRLAPK